MNLTNVCAGEIGTPATPRHVNAVAWVVLAASPIVVLGGCTGGSPNESVETATSSTAADTSRDPLAGRGDVVQVASGFKFSEGPQWMPDLGVLLFTDNADDTIYELDADDQVSVFRRPSNATNGLAVDHQGRLLAAEAGARRVTRTEADGSVTSIAETFEGSRLNQPNDIAVRSDGTIYFTDPAWGAAVDSAELSFRGIFRIDPTGTLTAEWRGAVYAFPNGVALSPDESFLYVANYEASTLSVFDVATDGALSGSRIFAYTGTGPDGIAIDLAGNVYVATANGIEVFAPDGTSWGTIAVPGGTPANCAFGGADGRTLFITAEKSLWRVVLAQPGIY